MTIRDGGKLNVGDDTDDYVAISRNSDTAGSSLLVTGAGSEVNCTGDFYVARNANGSLTVSDGALVSNAGNAWIGYRGAYDTTQTDNMRATVTGAGSEWQIGAALSIGENLDSRTFPHSTLTANLDIANGGKVTVGKETLLGSGLVGVTSKINFTGGTLDTGCLGADFANLTGTGTINAKGLITNTSLVIDEASDKTFTTSNGGNVTINVDIDGTGTMGAGYNGAGSLTISNGVVLNSTSGMLAHTIGSSATATVTGAGTQWNMSETLYVGQMGAATLTIADGALVKAATLCIDQDVAGAAAGGFDGYYYYTGYTGSVIDPDPSEQFDVAADSFVKLDTGAMLALEGDLSADLATFIGAVLGSSESLLWLDQDGDVWTSLSDATLGADCALTYDSGTGYTLLAIAAEWAVGDANHDGFVNGADVTILAGNWQASGSEVTWEMGDFNNDNLVDGADVTILAGNWQYSASDVTGNPVPEPSVLIMILGAMLVGWILRKK